MDLHTRSVSKTHADSVQALKEMTPMISPGLYGSRPGISSCFKRRL